MKVRGNCTVPEAVGKSAGRVVCLCSSGVHHRKPGQTCNFYAPEMKACGMSLLGKVIITHHLLLDEKMVAWQRPP